jgi:hypothetical protein
VVCVTDENLSREFLLLEMALQAERTISFREHPLVDGSVRRMTDHASFAHCFMFEDEWTVLRRMALEAGFVLTEESDAAALERLLNIRTASLDRHSDVRIMAIRAAHFSLQYWMSMR